LKIEILDSIMGSGKTTGIIKWMNDNPQNKYLYVSPLLTEVDERIPYECEKLEFVSPNTNEHKTKGDHLKELLKSGCNISFTHNLFTSLTKEHLRLISSSGYTLIIDEEIDFIDQYQGDDYKKADILTLEKSGHLEVDESNLGRVKWTWDSDKFEEGSNYDKLKRMCDLEMLHCAKRDRSMLVLHLPIALISAAKRTIVVTYMFKGSIMHKFMEMKGVDVEDFTEVKLIKTEGQVKYEAASLISLERTRSMMTVYNNPKRFRLSSSWYNDTASKEDLKVVSNALLSCCRKHKKGEVIYTLPKSVVKPDSGKAKVRIRGYHPDDCFLYCGTKATNEYSNRTAVVHAFNRHPMVSVMSYLQDYGFPIEADHFALTELIQFVWRSAIRDGKPISLYLISERMYKLFNSWLDGEEF